MWTVYTYAAESHYLRPWYFKVSDKSKVILSQNWWSFLNIPSFISNDCCFKVKIMVPSTEIMSQLYMWSGTKLYQAFWFKQKINRLHHDIMLLNGYAKKWWSNDQSHCQVLNDQNLQEVWKLPSWCRSYILIKQFKGN